MLIGPARLAPLIAAVPPQDALLRLQHKFAITDAADLARLAASGAEHVLERYAQSDSYAPEHENIAGPEMG